LHKLGHQLTVLNTAHLCSSSLCDTAGMTMCEWCYWFANSNQIIFYLRMTNTHIK